MLDSGFAGFSLSSFENDYGVPGEHAEGDTLIEMESDRFEFRSEIEYRKLGLVNRNRFELRLSEITNTAKVVMKTENNVTEWHTHATYLREGFEGKIAFKHEIGKLSGVFGIHGLFDEFKIVGEESIFGGLSRSWDDDNTSATYDNNYSDPSTQV